ncbi:MAG: hypothetical protein V9G11_00365 [Bifidobacterium adolescentis]
MKNRSRCWNLAIKFHENRFYTQPFAGPQAVAVLFDKPSTRTRSSFSIGVAELGGYPLVIDKSGSQLGRGEPVADTARVLDRMAYGVVWRTFGQDRVEEMAKYSTHPVVNALTDEFHPCQILADFQTIARAPRRCRQPRRTRPSPISATRPTTWPTPTCSAVPWRA